MSSIRYPTSSRLVQLFTRFNNNTSKIAYYFHGKTYGVIQTQFTSKKFIIFQFRSKKKNSQLDYLSLQLLAFADNPYLSSTPKNISMWS